MKLYQKFTHPKMFREAALKRAPGSEGPLLDLLAQVTQADIDEFRAGIEPLAARQAGRAAGAVSAELQGQPRVARLSRAAAARLQRLPGRRRAAPPELERRHRRHAGAAERVRRRVGADRRAEVPLLDSPELSAQRDDVLLHAPARPEREAVVAPRRGRGSLQLSVFREGAAGVRRHRRVRRRRS